MSIVTIQNKETISRTPITIVCPGCENVIKHTAPLYPSSMFKRRMNITIVLRCDTCNSPLKVTAKNVSRSGETFLEDVEVAIVPERVVEKKKKNSLTARCKQNKKGK